MDLPRDSASDATLALLREGYRFIPNRCRRLGDVFETRLMLSRAVCVQGEEAARAFYAPDRFTRRGALPPTTLRLLQDKGSVMAMDGDAHRCRKRMFLSLMTERRLAELADMLEAAWRQRLAAWERAGRVVLLDESAAVICRAVCAWSGVPLTEDEADGRAADLVAMIDGAGAIGPRLIRGLAARARGERWMRRVVRDFRAERIGASPESALHVIAAHRDLDGKALDTTTAAVELINVVRPTVAIAWYVAFAALALHEHPHCRVALEAGDDAALERFAHEVRRFYPFIPAMGGRALQDFEWRGHRFDAGTWMLLDLYGTGRDPRAWNDPEAFRPDRFVGWCGNPFTLIPQGGGGYEDGHRCPGERLVIELLKRSARLLVSGMRYTVPQQDLTIDLARIPARPASGFVMEAVHAT